jgi:hypothetical protein
VATVQPFQINVEFTSPRRKQGISNGPCLRCGLAKNSLISSSLHDFIIKAGRTFIELRPLIVDSKTQGMLPLAE